MDNLFKIIRKLSRWACWIAIAALAVMMLLTFFDVILRFFGYPIRGAFDVISLLGALVIAIPIAYTQTERQHIAIDFLVEKLPRKMRKFLDCINYMLNIGLYSVLMAQSYYYGNKLMKVGHVSETVQIPLFPVLYIITFSSGLMVLTLIAEFYSELRKEGPE